MEDLLTSVPQSSILGPFLKYRKIPNIIPWLIDISRKFFWGAYIRGSHIRIEFCVTLCVSRLFIKMYHNINELSISYKRKVIV